MKKAKISGGGDWKSGLASIPSLLREARFFDAAAARAFFHNIARFLIVGRRELLYAIKKEDFEVAGVRMHVIALEVNTPGLRAKFAGYKAQFEHLAAAENSKVLALLRLHNCSFTYQAASLCASGAHVNVLANGFVFPLVVVALKSDEEIHMVEDVKREMNLLLLRCVIIVHFKIYVLYKFYIKIYIVDRRIVSALPGVQLSMGPMTRCRILARLLWAMDSTIFFVSLKKFSKEKASSRHVQWFILFAQMLPACRLSV